MRINRYKLERRLARKRRRRTAPHHLDFSWQGGGGNPFFEKRRGMPLRKKFLLVSTIAAAVGSIGILFFHPFFAVQEAHIALQGVQRIDPVSMKETVLGIMRHRSWAIFPRDHYLLIDVREIEDILRERYPIESITVEKQFPKHLGIQITELVSTMLYDAGGRYATVGPDGRVVEVLRPTGLVAWDDASSTVYVPKAEAIHAAWGRHPIVFVPGGPEPTINAEVVSKEVAGAMLRLSILLERYTDIPIAYTTIEHEAGHATVKTEEGWEIRVVLDDTIDQQFEKCKTLLKEASLDRRSLHYIDVRYRDRVFWQ